MQQKAKKQPKTDAFSAICKADLKTECIPEFKFHPRRRWRFDYAFPQFKIALEVEGGVWTNGRHTRSTGFLGDMEKYNTAGLMGWRVFRVVPSNLMKVATINLLRMAICGSYNPESMKTDRPTNF